MRFASFDKQRLQLSILVKDISYLWDDVGQRGTMWDIVIITLIYQYFGF